MWYTTRHETTHFYSTMHRRRTTADSGGITLGRFLRVAPLPDPAGLCSWRTSPGDRAPTGLRRPDRAQCDQRVKRQRTGCRQRGLIASPSAAHDLHGRRSRAPQRSAASQPTRFWPGSQHLDPGIGRPDQLRARDHLPRGLRRECAPSAQAAENQLEARQALDYQPRPAVPAKKNARDRLIAWVSQQPAWAIGFLDEVWWSLFALPRIYTWQDPHQPVRLVEQSWKKGDPDPKALACYGVLWQEGTPEDPQRDQMWLRFVTGRPVSALTTQFLDWCCECLLKQRKTHWLLMWANASWQKSQAGRTWMRDHNQQFKATRKRVRS